MLSDESRATRSDPALRELALRVAPVAFDVADIQRMANELVAYGNGLVRNAFGAALKAMLKAMQLCCVVFIFIHIYMFYFICYCSNIIINTKLIICIQTLAQHTHQRRPTHRNSLNSSHNSKRVAHTSLAPSTHAPHCPRPRSRSLSSSPSSQRRSVICVTSLRWRATSSPVRCLCSRFCTIAVINLKIVL